MSLLYSGRWVAGLPLLGGLVLFAASTRADEPKVEVKWDTARTSPPDNLVEAKALQERVKTVAEKCTPCTVGIVIGFQSGSGVIVSEDGLVLTSASVVTGIEPPGMQDRPMLEPPGSPRLRPMIEPPAEKQGSLPKLRGEVEQVRGDLVILSIGLDAGLSKGSVLDLKRLTDGGRQLDLGTVKVVDISRKQATAVFTPVRTTVPLAQLRPEELPKKGDVVELTDLQTKSKRLLLSNREVSYTPGKVCTIILSDGKKVRAKTLGIDPDVDAAMVQITDKGPNNGKWPFLPVGKAADLKEGQWLIDLGHPNGPKSGRAPVVRLGRVEANTKDLLRTNCMLVIGDFGGPLVDLDGNVVGVHSRIGFKLEQNIHIPAEAFKSRWEKLAAGEVLGKNRKLGEKP